MDLQLCISDKSKILISESNGLLMKDDNLLEGSQIIYYSHGLTIATNYSNPDFDERKMLSYLEELSISNSRDCTCYYVDYYEQAGIPLLTIKEYQDEISKTITEDEFETKYQTNLYSLVSKLNNEYQKKIANS